VINLRTQLPATATAATATPWALAAFPGAFPFLRYLLITFPRKLLIRGDLLARRRDMRCCNQKECQRCTGE
jgi:hypothetical protein